MNVYLIISAIAIIFIIYIGIMAKYSSSRRKNQIEQFSNDHTELEIDNEQLSTLTFGAISAILHRENFWVMSPQQGLDKSFYGLKRQWKITSKEEAQSTLNTLLDLDASNGVDIRIQNDSIKGLTKIQNEISKLLKIPAQAVTAITSTFAYDLSRAVEVAKWSFWNGYLTEEEMWASISRVPEMARQRSADWEEYSISFLLGFTLDIPSPEELDECHIIVKHLLSGTSWDYTGMRIPAIYTDIQFNAQ